LLYICFTMRRTPLLPVLFLQFASALSSFSQTNSYDRHWAFGPYNHFDWISGSPVMLPGCAANTIEGGNCTNDVNGNLLFYGGDDKIYNANNVLMPNSVGLLCNTTPKQGPISVQVPGSATRYYYIYPQGAGGAFYYSIIDMTLQSGLGDVDNAFKNIQLRAQNCEGVVGIPRAGACDEFFIVTHNYNSNQFYTELISSSGIANFSAQNIGPVCQSTAGYMSYSPVTGKLSMLYGSFNVALFDFDAATGVLSNFVNVPLPAVPFCLEYYSSEFSPDGTKLYIGGGYGQNHLVQVDLANSNFVTIIATGNGGNTLKLGPDGKIYGQILYTSNIGIVNNPNNPGLSCNYVPNVINTGNVTYSDVGFPSMVLVGGANVNITATPSANPICAGDNVTITASAANTYSWSTGATTSAITVSPTATTTYTVTGMNGTCSDTAVVTITVNSSVTASISGNTTICEGTSTLLTASGGSGFSWSTGATTASISVTPTSTATYTVIVGTGSCSDTAMATVTVNSLPNVTLTPDSIICSGQQVTLTAGGGGMYAWNTGATTSSIIVSPTATATYIVTVTDINGCSASDSATITVNSAPTITVSGTTSICTGDQTTLTASGGNSYSWNTTATTTSITVSPAATATYTVTGTAVNGCTGATTITVTVNTIPVASITGNDSICEGQSVMLSGSGGGVYSWGTNEFTQNITVAPTATTTYSLVVEIGTCTDTAYFTVTVLPVPTAGAGADVTITSGSNTTLTATGGGTYSWSTGATTSAITVAPAATTTYCVYVTNSSGCVSSDCITVTVDPDCGELFVPTAFSPNGDNNNDILYIEGNCIVELQFEVFDRWGAKVFETADRLKGWDGIYKGQPLNTAVFAYKLRARLATGEEVNRKGNISLVR
jgi:gliding motility-associated-like protein